MSRRFVVALAGNPNSGKTTAFNEYTGARQHVGNYPGITVEKKEGYARLDGRDIHIVDLPGTYSLTAYTQEEVVARSVLADDRPDVVIDVVNAGALERNLYLAVQIMEMGAPVAIGLNMMDEARKQAISNARRRAELYAAAAGVRLGNVLQISESTGEVGRPVFAARSAPGAAVPIEAGTRVLTVEVGVVYALQ